MSKKEGEEGAGMINITRHEYEYLNYRATFTSNVIVAAAHRNRDMEFEEGTAKEIAKGMVRDSIMRGLDVGLFRPNGESLDMSNMQRMFGLDDQKMEEIQEKWDSAIPWSFVVNFASEFNVDADAVREAHRMELSARAAMIGSMGSAPGMSSEDFENGFREFLAGNGKEVWDALAKDRYILICAHDGHGCEHRFDTLTEAIESAAAGIMSGELESVGGISMNGSLVLTEDELKTNMERIMNAGNN